MTLLCTAQSNVGARDHDTEDRKLNNATYNPSLTDSPAARARTKAATRPPPLQARLGEMRMSKINQRAVGAASAEAIPMKPPVEVADALEHPLGEPLVIIGD